MRKQINKYVKVCALNNRGNNYNLLPALVVTPLHEVVSGYRLLSSREFKHSSVAEVREYYGFAGFRIAIKFWTFHLGVEIG